MPNNGISNLIFLFPCFYFYFVFSFSKLNGFPLESSISICLLFPLTYTVDKQFYFRLIRKDHDVSFFTDPFPMSAIGYVNKSIFLVPISLIEIECIFACFAITSYQTFVINARTISFFPMGRSEIKHVPDKRSPYERSFRQSFPVLHVIALIAIFKLGNS